MSRAADDRNRRLVRDHNATDCVDAESPDDAAGAAVALTDAGRDGA